MHSHLRKARVAAAAAQAYWMTFHPLARQMFLNLLILIFFVTCVEIDVLTVGV